MLSGRLFFCLFASAIVHLLLLVAVRSALPEIQPGPLPAISRPKAIRADLLPRKDTVVIKQVEPAVVAGNSAPSDHITTNLTPSENVGVESPSLVSTVNGYIDFPITSGFMILRLTIDQTGAVSETEVIYSELSRYATREIEKRFASADYRPATKKGSPSRGELLLKIKIE